MMSRLGLGGDWKNVQMTDPLFFADEHSSNIKESSTGTLLNSFIVLTPPASPDNISIQRCEKKLAETSVDDVHRAAEQLSNKLKILLERCNRIRRNVLSSYAEYIQSDFSFQSSLFREDKRGDSGCVLPAVGEGILSASFLNPSNLRACLTQIEHCYDSDATLSGSGDESSEETPNASSSFYMTWLSRQLKRTHTEAERYAALLDLTRKRNSNTEESRTFSNNAKIRQLSVEKINVPAVATAASRRDQLLRHKTTAAAAAATARKRRSGEDELTKNGGGSTGASGSGGSSTSQQLLTRKKLRHGASSCFDLDNIVSLDPIVSLSGPTLFARNNVDIKVPPWRVNKLTILEEAPRDIEDLSEAAFLKRHEPCELEEKDKLYLKKLKRQIKAANKTEIKLEDEIKQEPSEMDAVFPNTQNTFNSTISNDATLQHHRTYGYEKRLFPLDEKNKSPSHETHS